MEQRIDSFPVEQRLSDALHIKASLELRLFGRDKQFNRYLPQQPLQRIGFLGRGLRDVCRMVEQQQFIKIAKPSEK